MTTSQRDLTTIKERLETLDGSRRLGDAGRAAVRLNDLNGLMTLPETLKSAKAAGSTPTKAEFDALIDDVHELHRRVMGVVQALRGRRGR